MTGTPCGSRRQGRGSLAPWGGRRECPKAGGCCVLHDGWLHTSARMSAFRGPAGCPLLKQTKQSQAGGRGARSSGPRLRHCAEEEQCPQTVGLRPESVDVLGRRDCLLEKQKIHRCAASCVTTVLLFRQFSPEPQNEVTIMQPEGSGGRGEGTPANASKEIPPKLRNSSLTSKDVAAFSPQSVSAWPGHC